MYMERTYVYANQFERAGRGVIRHRDRLSRRWMQLIVLKVRISGKKKELNFFRGLLTTATYYT